MDSNVALVIATSVLAGITLVYVIKTSKIAEATKEQAEETRKQRLAMYKPQITLIIRTHVPLRGNYFALEIPVDLKNEGTGSAINIIISAGHPLFLFNTINYPNPLGAGQTTSYHALKLHLKNDENLPGTQQPVILIANYEDVLGNYWHSKLELSWDAAAKELKRGRLQVGLPGHLSDTLVIMESIID